jgi:hypothetical protein
LGIDNRDRNGEQEERHYQIRGDIPPHHPPFRYAVGENRHLNRSPTILLFIYVLRITGYGQKITVFLIL